MGWVPSIFSQMTYLHNKPVNWASSWDKGERLGLIPPVKADQMFEFLLY